MNRLTLTRPDDWHLHLRDGEALKAVLPHTVRQFARAIVMPNLKPPVRTVADAAAYRDRILAAMPEGQQFEPLMTLYLTDNTPPEEIFAAKETQFIKAVKYYPAGATTNSDSGVTDIHKCDRVFEAMQQADMPLLLHGEVTDSQVDMFDREKVFIEQKLAPLQTAVFPTCGWCLSMSPLPMLWNLCSAARQHRRYHYASAPTSSAATCPLPGGACVLIITACPS
jgi:dihydroorotase